MFAILITIITKVPLFALQAVEGKMFRPLAWTLIFAMAGSLLISLTIIPVIAMLKAGVNGPFGAVVQAVTKPDGSPDVMMYFWITGALSSFLDNAPTYLVFFNTAGGDPQMLMTTLAPTLAAISAGAVFMGANSYIGNAPNLMVKAIAEDRGVIMPSFFGYMLWSGAVLIPLFVVMSFIWFK
jgi:Na+/H+ antiporter NhaD/arsenite permease-like protein